MTGPARKRFRAPRHVRYAKPIKRGPWPGPYTNEFAARLASDLALHWAIPLSYIGEHFGTTRTDRWSGSNAALDHLVTLRLLLEGFDRILGQVETARRGMPIEKMLDDDGYGHDWPSCLQQLGRSIFPARMSELASRGIDGYRLMLSVSGLRRLARLLDEWAGNTNALVDLVDRFLVGSARRPDDRLFGMTRGEHWRHRKVPRRPQ